MAEPTSQNLNNSPSPGGDGVRSSQSERSAAGLNTADNQPGQQRVNAAERRERGENAKSGDKAGERASLIQSPGEVIPGDAGAEAINAAESARKDREDADHKLKSGGLPQATLDEMNAGKSALERNKPRNEATDSNSSGRAVKPTNPVDDLNARQQAGTTPPQQNRY